MYLKPKQFFIFCLLIISHLPAQEPEWLKIHNQALVVDLHSDALMSLLRGRPLNLRSNSGHVDFVRLAEGGIDAQFFVAWPDPDATAPNQMFEHTSYLVDTLKNHLEKFPKQISIVYRSEELLQNQQAGKISAFLCIEGGSALENDPAKVAFFYEKGVRYLGLTWNNSSEWASSGKDEYEKKSKTPGLRGRGAEIISEMNRLGMLVDLSHAGRQTYFDVLKIARKPVILSHSSVAAICPHYRNIDDQQLRALAANGGVIFINFYPGYLKRGFNKTYDRAARQADEKIDSLRRAGDKAPFDRAGFIRKKIGRGWPDITDLVDHIDYVVRLIGDDHVGLGSDFDGISLLPDGLNSAADYGRITKEMQRRGYSAQRIRKILGGNFLRVLQANEQNSKPDR